ncbi:MAG: hypothetical protein Kow001_01040 [Acidobacteriota bacterium]
MAVEIRLESQGFRQAQKVPFWTEDDSAEGFCLGQTAKGAQQDFRPDTMGITQGEGDLRRQVRGLSVHWTRVNLGTLVRLTP